MKAKDIIINKAEELIDRLVAKEESRLNEIRKNYEEFLVDHPVDEPKYGTYSFGENSPYTRMSQFALKSIGVENYLTEKSYRYSSAHKIQVEVQLATSERQMESYLENYRVANRVKLVRAIEKYITEEMKVKGDVLVTDGVKGVEVSAIVEFGDDVKKFKTNAIFAGGYIQRYHYRYRGGLVKV